MHMLATEFQSWPSTNSSSRRLVGGQHRIWESAADLAYGPTKRHSVSSNRRQHDALVAYGT